MHRYHITSLSANVLIVKTCLTYLLNFESPTILTADVDLEFPLTRFAAEFWHWHYKYITDDSESMAVDILGYNLVDSKNYGFTNWLRIVDLGHSWGRSDLELKTYRIPSPLYLMSYLGVSGVVQLLSYKAIDIGAESSTYDESLSVASEEGHERVV